MKLRTFLWLLGGGAVLGVGGLGAALVFGGSALLMALPAPAPPPAKPLEVKVETPYFVPKPTAAPPAAGDQPAAVSGAPWDVVALGYRNKNLGVEKIKDAIGGMPWKINVYQDAGHAAANRAKVDLDRDEKWDIKYTFEADGAVLRQTAPADDEVYSVEEVWRGGAWEVR